MKSLYWIAFSTLVRKEITRFMRIWVQTLVPPVITMTLYFLIFGQLIGRQIGSMQGVSYIEYIAPGLIMMSVITSSYGNTVSSFFSAKFQSNIEELMIAPMPHFVVIAGYVVAGVCRGLLTGFIVTLVTACFVNIHFSNMGIVVLTVILTSILFSLAGLLNALFAKSFDDISIIPTFVLTPLTYLGGVFYSLDMLPDVWKFISGFNPIVYMINAFRYGFLGISDIDISLSFLLILLFITCLYGMTYRLFKSGFGLRS